MCGPCEGVACRCSHPLEFRSVAWLFPGLEPPGEGGWRGGGRWARTLEVRFPEMHNLVSRSELPAPTVPAETIPEGPSASPCIEAARVELSQVISRARARVAELTEASGALSLEERAWLAGMEDGLLLLQERLVPVAGPPARPVVLEPPREEGDRGRFKVLCVGADADDRKRVAQLASSWFSLRFAPDAAAAARLALEERPDLILADLAGADLERLSLVSRLRTEDELSEMPVIAISDRADAEAKVHAFESGAFDFISKGLLESELVLRVRNALVRSEALRHERLVRETDDLTGLPTRRRFRSFLSSAIRSCRNTRSDLSVVMVDMNGLKPINDRFGHAAGDRALRALAEALEQCKRGSDLAARIGGDEFVVVLPNTDCNGAQGFITRVQEMLSRPVMRTADGQPLIFGASFGIASLGESGWDERVEDLVGRADAALYRAKADHYQKSL